MVYYKKGKKMIIGDLKVIYDRENIQAGDTDLDFYEWAVTYLLDKETEHKKLIAQINRHIIGLNKAIEKLDL
jgi:hypothetical protein